MINIERKTPPKEVLDILENEKSKKSGEYNKKEVFNTLAKEFYNKCYICENKSATSINIEHFKPHKGDKELEFSWENLFLACAHCNNIKLGNYDNILDCTNLQHDVENWIKYYVDMFPKAAVQITARKDDEVVKSTVELLDKVYNGTTHQKIFESENIVKQLQTELISFQTDLWEYYKSEDEEDKEIYRRKIKRHLHKSSSFAAFKRWIIKDNQWRYDEFKQFI
jgi:uncharacterized protein (TIGR02646 family)